MGDSLAIKKNLSSIQVLKTLKLLLEGDFTMAELVSRLNADEEEAVFNNSVVSKYINTCRYIGVEIPKINNRYFVAKIPFGLDISSQELDLIEYMQVIAQKCLAGKSIKIFNSFIETLNKFSNKHIVKVEPGNGVETRENFDKAIQEHRKVRLLFRSKESVECNPIEMVNKQGRLYFNVNEDGKEKLYSVDRITGLEILDKKYLLPYGKNEAVVFKLKGNLSKRYQMRENETELMRTDNYITISNLGESREALYTRLLRYDSLCEVLEPAVCREDMKKIIDNMLSNYGV